MQGATGHCVCRRALVRAQAIPKIITAIPGRIVGNRRPVLFEALGADTSANWQWHRHYDDEVESQYTAKRDTHVADTLTNRQAHKSNHDEPVA